MRRVLLVLVACAAALTISPPAQAVDGTVQALERNAKPLRSTSPTGSLADLEPFGRMVGEADVVGLGEATHSSKEFFTMKHRMFRYLVERKGFRAFSLEIAWSSGIRLNDYVLHGKGDLDRILREEFFIWHTTEFRDLFRWMREYNRTHADKVEFTGNDISFPGPEIFDPIFRYAGPQRPTLFAAYVDLYRNLRPDSTDAVGWMYEYLERPVAERRAVRDQVKRLFAELRETPVDAWTEQNARVLDQTMTMLATDLGDPKQLAEGMLHRDRSMAYNTAWWHEHTGDKVLLSAHNGHVGYVSDDPDHYPKLQGAFLRDRLGDRYRSVGYTFYQGSFNAEGEDGKWQPFTVGPPGQASNEHTLDRVRYRDFYLDMRTAPVKARTWLSESRPTKNIGTVYPYPDAMVPLRPTYDVLIHLHQVTRANLLSWPAARSS